MKKLFCSLALLMASPSMFARADTFEIGGKAIVVPVPQGFVRVTEAMPTVNRFCEQIAAADPANDTLASYILESGVPTAIAGEIPLLDRYFILKVNNGIQRLTVSKNDFAEFKKIIRDQNDALWKRVDPMIREGMSKMSEGVSQEFDVKFTVEISQVVPLAPHYEEENALAFSMFSSASYEVAAEEVGEVKETNITSGTSTYLNAAGRVLFLYSYGQQGDLEWTRTASRDWANEVLGSNLQPPQGSWFDWNKIGGKALVGAFVGGLLGLLTMAFQALQRYFKRTP